MLSADPPTWQAEAPPLEEDKYAEFYEIDEPVIRFEGGVNEIGQRRDSYQRRRRLVVKQEKAWYRI